VLGPAGVRPINDEYVAEPTHEELEIAFFVGTRPTPFLDESVDRIRGVCFGLRIFKRGVDSGHAPRKKPDLKQQKRSI
jgi:hypothetical protein